MSVRRWMFSAGNSYCDRNGVATYFDFTFTTGDGFSDITNLSADSIFFFGKFTHAINSGTDNPSSLSPMALNISFTSCSLGNALLMKYSAISSSSSPFSRMPYAKSTPRPARPTC